MEDAIRNLNQGLLKPDRINTDREFLSARLDDLVNSVNHLLGQFTRFDIPRVWIEDEHRFIGAAVLPDHAAILNSYIVVIRFHITRTLDRMRHDRSIRGHGLSEMETFTYSIIGNLPGYINGYFATSPDYVWLIEVAIFIYRHLFEERGIVFNI